MLEQKQNNILCSGRDCTESAMVLVYVPYFCYKDIPFCLDCEAKFKIACPTAITIDQITY